MVALRKCHQVEAPAGCQRSLGSLSDDVQEVADAAHVRDELDLGEGVGALNEKLCKQFLCRIAVEAHQRPDEAPEAVAFFGGPGDHALTADAMAEQEALQLIQVVGGEGDGRGWRCRWFRWSWSRTESLSRLRMPAL